MLERNSSCQMQDRLEGDEDRGREKNKKATGVV